MGEVTKLLERINAGEDEALSVLMPLVYDRLREMARRQLHRSGADGHTLNTTGLVHELFLNLHKTRALPRHSRDEFYAYAATAMRNILVDAARQRLASKRGGSSPRQRDDTIQLAIDDEAHDLLAVDHALTHLQSQAPRLAKVIELRFFAGLDVPDTASALDCSKRTVERDWQKARLFLHRRLAVQGNTHE